MPAHGEQIVPTTHILFDFFGTLVDYSKGPMGRGFEMTHAHLEKAGYRSGYDAFIKAWSETYQELDHKASVSHREFTLEDIAVRLVERVLARQDLDLSRSIARAYMTEWNRGVSYRPGVGALLTRLSDDYVLAIVSNTHEPELVPGHLSTMGVSELFHTVITSVGFGIRKPNRAIFEHAITSLNTKPEHCIYVGDNYEADFRGATSVGIKTYLIDPRGNAPVPHDARIDSVLSLGTQVLSLELPSIRP